MTNFGACDPTTSGCSDLADITTPAVDESEILAVGDAWHVIPTIELTKLSTVVFSCGAARTR